MYTRLYKYLSKFSIISDDQFGFRKGHSTSMALIHLHTKIAKSNDQNKFSIPGLGKGIRHYQSCHSFKKI